MDIPENKDQQEIANLLYKLEQAKLNKAEELLQHRLGFLIILFIILRVTLEDANNGKQWLCSIAFFGIVLLVAGRISIHYSYDKKEARK